MLILFDVFIMRLCVCEWGEGIKKILATMLKNLCVCGCDFFKYHLSLINKSLYVFTNLDFFLNIFFLIIKRGKNLLMKEPRLFAI